MRKTRFTEHQIIAVLKSVKAGRIVNDELVSLKPSITTGKQSTVVWKPMISKR